MISSKEKNRAGKNNEKNDANIDKITRKGFSEELALEERPERGEDAVMQSRSLSGQRNSRARGPWRGVCPVSGTASRPVTLQPSEVKGNRSS